METEKEIELRIENEELREEIKKLKEELINVHKAIQEKTVY